MLTSFVSDRSCIELNNAMDSLEVMSTEAQTALTQAKRVYGKLATASTRWQTERDGLNTQGLSLQVATKSVTLCKNKIISKVQEQELDMKIRVLKLFKGIYEFLLKEQPTETVRDYMPRVVMDHNLDDLIKLQQLANDDKQPEEFKGMCAYLLSLVQLLLKTFDHTSCILLNHHLSNILLVMCGMFSLLLNCRTIHILQNDIINLTLCTLRLQDWTRCMKNIAYVFGVYARPGNVWKTCSQSACHKCPVKTLQVSV